MYDKNNGKTHSPLAYARGLFYGMQKRVLLPYHSTAPHYRFAQHNTPPLFNARPSYQRRAFFINWVFSPPYKCCNSTNFTYNKNHLSLMKELFLSLTLVAVCSIAAMAQVRNIGVRNNTSYTISFILHGDPAGACGTAHTSTTYTLAPGMAMGFSDPSTVPSMGLSYGSAFTAVEVFGSSACSASTNIVYDCTGGSNTLITSPSISLGTTLPCTTVVLSSIQWVPQSPVTALVEVY